MDNKNKKKGASEKESAAIYIPDGLISTEVNFFEKVLRRAFDAKRDLIIGALEEKIQLLKGAASVKSENNIDKGDWVGIESLSRLRNVVGGRFENLRKRWRDAGFPLRERKGDRDGDFTIDKEGWLELTNWIAKQGFECRLAAKGSESVFEIRKV